MGTEEVNAYSQWLSAKGGSQPGRNARVPMLSARSCSYVNPSTTELYSWLQTWQRDLM